MPDDSESIELELTPEQQAVIRRLSGQHANVLQLKMNPEDSSEGTGRSVQFRWRLSDTTGIPRQRWDSEKAPGKE